MKKVTVKNVAEAQAMIQQIAPATYTAENSSLALGVKAKDRIEWYNAEKSSYCIQYKNGEADFINIFNEDDDIIATITIDNTVESTEEKAEEYTVKYRITVMIDGEEDSERRKVKFNSHGEARQFVKKIMTVSNFEAATIEPKNGFNSYHVYKAEEAGEVTVANFTAEVENLVSKIENSKALGAHVTVKELEKELGKVREEYQKKLVYTTLAMEIEDFYKLYESTVANVKVDNEKAAVEVEEYAVSVDAQEVAAQAEVDAAKENEKKLNPFSKYGDWYSDWKSQAASAAGEHYLTGERPNLIVTKVEKAQSNSMVQAEIMRAENALVINREGFNEDKRDKEALVVFYFNPQGKPAAFVKTRKTDIYKQHGIGGRIRSYEINARLVFNKYVKAVNLEYALAVFSLTIEQLVELHSKLKTNEQATLTYNVKGKSYKVAEAEVATEETPVQITISVQEGIAKELTKKLMANIATLSSIHTVDDDTYQVFDVNTKATVNFEDTAEETAMTLDEAYKKVTEFFLTEDDGSNDDPDDEDFLATLDTSVDEDGEDDELVDPPVHADTETVDVVTEFEVGKTYVYVDCFEESAGFFKVMARFKDGNDTYITVKDSSGNYLTFKVLLGEYYKLDGDTRYIPEYIDKGLCTVYSYDDVKVAS